MTGTLSDIASLRLATVYRHPRPDAIVGDAIRNCWKTPGADDGTNDRRTRGSCDRLRQLALALGIVAGTTHPAQAGRATLNLVLVLDGLRPDAITPEETPNLWRLRQEGVNFPNSHAVFPTVTRVNATAIATGTYPARNGILGNRIYVRAVDPNLAFPNDDHRNLLRLDEVTGGGMVLAKSLGEILAERGKRLAAVSSGSTGSALLLNPRAPKGVGVLINGYWEPGVRVAFPPAVNDAVLQRFGAAPAKGGATDAYDAAVAWTQGVLRDYVLPELKPDVVINWLTEPDHIQHGIGAGSPQARASIRADRCRGRALAQAARRARPRRRDQHHRGVRSRLRPRRLRRQPDRRADQGRAQGERRSPTTW